MQHRRPLKLAEVLVLFILGDDAPLRRGRLVLQFTLLFRFFCELDRLRLRGRRLDWRLAIRRARARARPLWRDGAGAVVDEDAADLLGVVREPPHDGGEVGVFYWLLARSAGAAAVASQSVGRWLWRLRWRLGLVGQQGVEQRLW